MKNYGTQFYARAIICTSVFLILFFISFSEADININDRRLRRDHESQPFHNTRNQFGKYYTDPLVKLNRFRRRSSGLGFPLRIQIRSLLDEAKLGEMAMNATEKAEKEKKKSK